MSHHMILWLCFFVKILLCICAEACFPRSFNATAPQQVEAGYVISKVNVVCSDSQLKYVYTSDPDFAMHPNGTIVALHSTKVPSTGRAFSVWTQTNNGQHSNMDVYISQRLSQPPKNGILKRFKRAWGLPPFNITENDNSDLPKAFGRFQSTSSLTHKVYYLLFGPGMDKDPMGVFSLENADQFAKLILHKPVDREQYSNLTLQAKAFDKITHKETDKPMPIIVNVIDVNDNAPVITGSLEFSVLEHSAGAEVGKVNATDKDQAGTDHTKIKYTLLDGNHLFSIDSQTGVIKTKTAKLDREAGDKHFITIEVRDMNGAADGLFSTATATVLLEDINDNPPTFSKTSYSVNVNENMEKEILLLRIPVDDKDQIKTANWNCVFAITKGNDGGHFRIKTDPDTNDGLLYLTKPLNFEANRALRLEVQARNQAKLSGTQAGWASVSIEVNVQDVDEGPEAPDLQLYVKEGLRAGELIGTYTATDRDTGSSQGIRYYEISDPASWIEIGETTGKLKTTNTVERESHFVKNNMYNITVKAVGLSAKTATGTIFITVEDVNDHIPLIPKQELILCRQKGKPGSVAVVAQDKDGKLFSTPFHFELTEPHKGKWTLSQLNDTAATLASEHPLGLYKVPMLVRDSQGKGETQTATVRICRCANSQCVDSRSSATLGAEGTLVLLLVLALCMLLFIGAACMCVGKEKKEIDDVAGCNGRLRSFNTEGPGEEGSIPIIVPTQEVQLIKSFVVDSSKSGSMKTNCAAETWQTVEPLAFLQQSCDNMKMSTCSQHALNSMAVDSACFSTQIDALHIFRTNDIFLDMRLNYLATGDEGRYADDILHEYGFEGDGSVAGSVDCCIDQNHDDLDFLNTLGPKFRPLANVCHKQ